MKTRLEYINTTIWKYRNRYRCCDGWTGLENSNCTIPVCNPECLFGQCIKPYECECLDGWMGSICGDKCNGGKYGKKCSETCNCGNGSVTCHHVTGECQCAPGFTGERCQSICSPGRYGFGCSESCNCLSHSQCRASDGFCDCSQTVLKPHADISTTFNDSNNLNEQYTKIPEPFYYDALGFFTGAYCKDLCVPDYNCTKLCDCELRNGDCNIYTGKCICKPGFFGKRCQSMCAKGTFGPDCIGRCLCQNNSTCDSITGSCRCLPGWSGEHCQNACQKGRFGPGCNSQCSCSHFTSCDTINGSCTCLDGWTGLHCDRPCPLGWFGAGCGKTCDCGTSWINTTMNYHRHGHHYTLESKLVDDIDKETKNDVDMDINRGDYDNYLEVFNRTLLLVAGSLKSDDSNAEEKTQSQTNLSRNSTTSSINNLNHFPKGLCDPVDGRCNCPPGRTGPRCERGCGLLRFGPDCSLTCDCEHATKCDPITGKCSACQEGWHGERCQIACIKGYYGPNCETKCDCVGAETCHPITGTCICPAGKTGNNCSEDCPTGWYGVFCQHGCACPSNPNNRCDPVTGFCSCPPGLSTRFRCTRCQTGLFGPDCSLTCPCSDETGRNGTAPCKRLSGECLCPSRLDSYNKGTKNNESSIENVTFKKINEQEKRYLKDCLRDLIYTFDSRFDIYDLGTENRVYSYSDDGEIGGSNDHNGYYGYANGGQQRYNLAKEIREHNEAKNKTGPEINLMSIVFIILTSMLLIIFTICLAVCLVVKRRKSLKKHSIMKIIEIKRDTSLPHIPTTNSDQSLPVRLPPSHNTPDDNIYCLGDEDDYDIDYAYPASVFGTIERKGFNSLSILPSPPHDPSMLPTVTCPPSHADAKNPENFITPPSTLSRCNMRHRTSSKGSPTQEFIQLKQASTVSNKNNGSKKVHNHVYQELRNSCNSSGSTNNIDSSSTTYLVPLPVHVKDNDIKNVRTHLIDTSDHHTLGDNFDAGKKHVIDVNKQMINKRDYHKLDHSGETFKLAKPVNSQVMKMYHDHNRFAIASAPSNQNGSSNNCEPPTSLENSELSEKPPPVPSRNFSADSFRTLEMRASDRHPYPPKLRKSEEVKSTENLLISTDSSPAIVNLQDETKLVTQSYLNPKTKKLLNIDTIVPNSNIPKIPVTLNNSNSNNPQLLDSPSLSYDEVTPSNSFLSLSSSHHINNSWNGEYNVPTGSTNIDLICKNSCEDEYDSPESGKRDTLKAFHDNAQISSHLPIPRLSLNKPLPPVKPRILQNHAFPYSQTNGRLPLVLPKSPSFTNSSHVSMHDASQDEYDSPRKI
ncbi:unnamed protein product [Gordionus sp. m RMFG-2023]